MNQCNGNGLCGAYGFCQCNEGYKGADCSYKAYKCENCVVKTEGDAWFYLQVDAGHEASIRSLRDSGMSLYISKGKNSNPNKFDYDILIKEAKKDQEI
jgi:hypothetical protein